MQWFLHRFPLRIADLSLDAAGSLVLSFVAFAQKHGALTKLFVVGGFSAFCNGGLENG